MYSSQHLSALACVFAIPLAASLPLLNNHLEPRLVNCSDLATSFDETCWNSLDLSDWLNNPTTGWNKTTPVCTAAQDDATCCVDGVPWTTCFLRLARGRADEDCSMINAQDCPSNLSDRLGPNITAQAQYVMKNIYGSYSECSSSYYSNAELSVAINDFFTTLYEALAYATTQAQSIIQSVVTEIDPKEATGFLLSDILTALSFGLAFIVAPEVAAGVQGIEAATAAAGEAFLTGLQNAPAVGKAIWPTGTLDSQSIQIGALESELNHVTTNLSNMVDAGLRLIMSDMPSFVAFASTGAFSGSTSLSLPVTTQGLDLALRTYIVSNAMTQNKWKATGHTNLTRDQVQSSTPGSGGWACTLGPNDICVGEYGGVFYSQDTMRAFSLTTTGNTDTTGLQLMNDIVKNGWSSLPFLFDGAYNCTAAGKFGTTPYSFGPNGIIDLSCMSQLQFCIACGAPCPVDLIDGACPFPPCQKQQGFC